MDLEKLKQDLKNAKFLALKAASQVDDGGTANVDAMVLRPPKGARADRILDAVGTCGLRAHVTQWLGRGVMISPPGSGQGNKRYAANEAMLSSMAAAGWRVTGYYQMD